MPTNPQITPKVINPTANASNQPSGLGEGATDIEVTMLRLHPKITSFLPKMTWSAARPPYTPAHESRRDWV